MCLQRANGGGKSTRLSRSHHCASSVTLFARNTPQWLFETIPRSVKAESDVPGWTRVTTAPEHIDPTSGGRA